MYSLKQYQKTVQFIQNQTNVKPKVGIILGTGLNALIDDMEVSHVISYEDLEGFPVSTVETHQGKLVFGKLSQVEVVVMQGRAHFYEGYTFEQIAFPVRVMKLLGIEKLFVSNVAGGINPVFELGDLMVLSDHINLQPGNPLIGKNIPEFGPRFPDMLNSYDIAMIEMALKTGILEDYRIYPGVYASVPGPQLETKAEYKYLSIIGADAVGMSTVPEIIAARHAGIPCFAISAITDLCYEPYIKPVDIEEIIATAMSTQPKMTVIFKSLIQSIYKQRLNEKFQPI